MYIILMNDPEQLVAIMRKPACQSIVTYSMCEPRK